MRHNYKIMKIYMFNWHLALMRKYRMNEICYFVKNKYKRKLKKKLFKFLYDYTQQR